MSCATCCAIYSTFGIILLLFFGAMFQRNAVSMQLIAAKNDWDAQEKASACFRAAAMYAATLFISVLYKTYSAKSAVTTAGKAK